MPQNYSSVFENHNLMNQTEFWAKTSLWVRWWVRRLLLWEKHLPHVSHVYGFSPVWIRWWISRWLTRSKLLPQNGQMNHFSFMRRLAIVLCNSGSFKRKNLLSGLKADMFLVCGVFSERNRMDTPLSGWFIASIGWLGWAWLKVTGALGLSDAPWPLSRVNLSEYAVSAELSRMSKAFWMSRISESRFCDKSFGSKKQSESSAVSLSPTETDDHCWLSCSSAASTGCWFSSISQWPAPSVTLCSQSIICSTIWTSSSSSSLTIKSSSSLLSLSQESDLSCSLCFSSDWASGDDDVGFAEVSAFSLTLCSEDKVWTESITGPEMTEQVHVWALIKPFKCILIDATAIQEVTNEMCRGRLIEDWISRLGVVRWLIWEERRKN